MEIINFNNKVSKITVWVICGIVVLCVCALGYFFFKDSFHPEFIETKIYPNDNRVVSSDTVFIVNGVPFRMIGVNGGAIDCQGLDKTIELDDFYIGETEVTQQLWFAIMKDRPFVSQRGDSLPVTNVNLMECLDFVNALDSVSGVQFAIPSYYQWLYAAYLGKIHSDGNIADWTISGADPLFIVAGDNSENGVEQEWVDIYKFVDMKIKVESIGLRLVYIP